MSSLDKIEVCIGKVVSAVVLYGVATLAIITILAVALAVFRMAGLDDDGEN